MKNVALLIYPDFSLQEIGDVMFLFRWGLNCKTTTFSTSKEIVYSEEGIGIVPEKTVDEFRKEDYHCLILSGCSNFGKTLENEKLFQFLHSFKNDNDFIIAAICSSPFFLAIAGLLDNKKFVNSLFQEENECLSIIDQTNFTYQPVVIDGNIITAVGEAFRDFAITVARACGLSCSDKALQGFPTQYKKEDFLHPLPKEELEEFMKKDLLDIEKKCKKLKKAL